MTTDIEKNLDTHYLLILDRSGSMSSCWDATIEGLNEQLGTIRSLEEEYPEQKYYVSLVAFDSEILTVFEDKHISDIKDFDGTEFPPRGLTALHDAMGVGISTLKVNLKKRDKKNNSITTALVVIMTDGGENASKENTADSLKKMINELEDTGAWTFSFMGANQDAVMTAGGFGIGKGNVLNYSGSAQGTTVAYSTLTRGISARANSNSRLYSKSISDTGSVSLDSMNMNTDNFLSEVVDGDTIGDDDSNVKK